MKFIKLLCILMALVMVLSMGMLFLGCSENDTSENDDENDEYIIASWYETLDFEGQEIRFLTQLEWNRFTTPLPDTLFDSMTRSIAVDPLDDQLINVNIAVNKRNDYVEAQLGVKIEQNMVNNMANYLLNIVLSGITDYDVFQMANFRNIGLLLHENAAGQFIDLNMISSAIYDIEEGENFIRPSKPWWDTNRYEQMTYNGRAFFITGHLTQSWTAGLYLAFVNANLWTENAHHVASLTGGETNIHKIVREGGWHLDFITQLSNLVYTNLSGREAITINDRVGIVLQDTGFVSNVIPQALSAGAGVRYVDVDANGNWYIALNAASDHGHF